MNFVRTRTRLRHRTASYAGYADLVRDPACGVNLPGRRRQLETPATGGVPRPLIPFRWATSQISLLAFSSENAFEPLVAKIAALRGQRRSIREIAAELKCSRSLIHRSVLHLLGVAINSL
jgi:hypothetical protein